MFDNGRDLKGLPRRDFLRQSGLGLALLSTTKPSVLLALAKTEDITALSGIELSAAIKARRISCREVMSAYLERVEQLNGIFNALVSMADTDLLLEAAERADLDLAAGLYRGWMHGFPIAIKDLANAKGFATTKGSPLYANSIAQQDDIYVNRMKAAGGIVIGKTNVPEFGLGSQTYNPLFGATKCAYDESKTAGGSSGGAAVSLALHMQPIADGSDLMGSLRNPAAFNNVIGFRPTPGRVPIYGLFIEDLPCNGPMARNVSDTAMLLSTMAGYHPDAPTTIPDNPAQFAAPLERDFKGTRIGWLGDFNGYLPMEPGVLPLCEKALATFIDLGCEVENATIEYSMAALWQTWLTFRHWIVAGLHAHEYKDPVQRELLKPECQWEVAGGLRLTANDVFKASTARAAFYAAMLKLFDDFDYLVLPAAQVFPFAAEQHWPQSIAGINMDSYHRWMEVVVPGTLSGCPIAAVPAGFNASGLPMGIQIIGKRYQDFATLQMAYAYEQASRWNLEFTPSVIAG